MEKDKRLGLIILINFFYLLAKNYATGELQHYQNKKILLFQYLQVFI